MGEMKCYGRNSGELKLCEFSGEDMYAIVRGSTEVRCFIAGLLSMHPL